MRIWCLAVTTVLISGCCSERAHSPPAGVPGKSVHSADFRASLTNVTHSPFVEGNRITQLVNGDEFFPAMLDAIRNARKTITLENFIWRSGKISDQFIAALSERARAGVRVHVIMDALGTVQLKDTDIETMRKAGVRFVKYHRAPKLHRINNRDHRKLLVVDGRAGITGGSCIADEWMGNAETEKLWRDTDFKIEGPVVPQLQSIFATNWLQTERESLHGEDYFPKDLPVAGKTPMQAFASGPREGDDAARLVYVQGIAAATNNICIGQSYFVPDESVMKELLAARARGVTIEVITPGKIDINIVRRASRSRWPELLKAGVKFYEYGPALYHCKIMIVDDFFVTAGSVNLDERSFQINDEANINVLDREFAAKLRHAFELDKAQSKPITERAFRNRSWMAKAMENFAGLFRSQL